MESSSLLVDVGDETVVEARCGAMTLAARFDPFGTERRRVRVAFKIALDLGDLDDVGKRQRLRVDLAAADHPHLRFGRADRKSFPQRACAFGALRVPVGLPRDDDVAAPGQRPEARRHRIPGLAAHDHGRAHGDLLEMRHVFRQAPGHDTVLADHAIGGARIDQTDLHAFRPRRVP
jgi:hypothetical protein